MQIKNKIVVVTGASGGIGLATARLLAKQGATVVLAARSADKLTALAKELPGAFAVPTDMREPEDITHLVDSTLKKFGRIDIWVNNAGQGMYGPAEHINIENYRKVWELNVLGPLRAMQAVIPVMRKQGGGLILNVSSLVSKNYFPSLSAYASTKYALNAISLTAREELAKDHIIISVMHPKMTTTDFGRNAIGARPDYATRGTADRPRPDADPPEAVAEGIAKLIASEEPEARM